MNTKELETGMIASGKNRRQRLEIVYALLSNTHDTNQELATALRNILPAAEFGNLEQSPPGFWDEEVNTAIALLAKLS